MINTKPVQIIGTGSYIPKKVLTNNDLEKIVETSNEWIITRTGIYERHLVEKEETTSDLCLKASLRAIKEANITPEEIDLIIVATNSPDMLFPSTACLLQEKIKAINAATFDLQAGCTGFIYALIVAWQFIATGFYENALVVGAEVISKFIDWSDRNTCVLFGDGAGAVVLKVGKERGILSGYLKGDGRGANLIQLPAGAAKIPASNYTIEQRLHYIKMKGNEVFKVAVKEMKHSTINALTRGNLSVEDVNLFIPHQANIRIIAAVARVLGIRKDKIFLNLQKYGNTSAASVVIALDEAIKEERIKNGDIVVLTAFGAGLTSGSVVFCWTK